MAAAPSFNPEEFPAVTLPPSFLKAALNLPKTSNELFGLIRTHLYQKLNSPLFYVAEFLP